MFLFLWKEKILEWLENHWTEWHYPAPSACAYAQNKWGKRRDVSPEQDEPQARTRNQQISLRPLACPWALWAGHYGQEESLMEPSDTALCPILPTHPAAQTGTIHPTLLSFSWLVSHC